MNSILLLVTDLLYPCAVICFVPPALMIIYYTPALIDFDMGIRGFVIQWNDGIGKALYDALVGPLEFLNFLAGAMLPVYNTMIWISKRALKEGLIVPIMESPIPLYDATRESALFAKASAVSLYAYSSASFRACGVNDTTRCVTDVGTRVFDIITPMSHVRKVVAVVLAWIATSVCGPLAAPLDVLLAPVMDINFAKGVHNLVNAVLWMFIQIPIVTEARCRLYEESDGLIMCIPDFEPVFRMLVEGLRRMGAMVDNWMDVTLLIVQEVIAPGTAPRCDSTPLSILDVNGSVLFKSNQTILVGLTETLFATTDGYSVIYYTTAKSSLRGQIGRNLWPIHVDIRMGIAAVQFGNGAGEQMDDQGYGKTTSMMGCRWDLIH